MGGSARQLARIRFTVNDEVGHVNQRDVVEAIVLHDENHASRFVEQNAVVLDHRYHSTVVQMQFKPSEGALVQGVFDVAGLNHGAELYGAAVT